jgi:hypothetical protein
VSAVVPDGALCLSCNYALRGLESRRCPECGRGFDPDAPLTMNQGRPLDRVALALLRPIGRWAPATMWLLAVTGVLGPAWLVPSNALACLWLVLWGGFLLACWWRSVLRRLVVARYRQPPECLRIDDPFRRRTRRVFAVVTLLIVTRAPFLLALLISRPWLDHQAYYVWAVLPSDVQPQASPRLQGLVMVRRIDAGPTYVTFHLFGGGTVTYRPASDEESLECTWSTWQEHF